MQIRGYLPEHVAGRTSSESTTSGLGNQIRYSTTETHAFAYNAGRLAARFLGAPSLLV
jgi:hypothetical protein